jgi:hypothetical protein
VLRDTLLERTHQWWKLRLATVGIVVSLVIQFLPIVRGPGSSDRDIPIYVGVSMLLAGGSLLLLFWGVRCPHCHAKWAQLAAKQPGGRWLKWLSDLQICPRCGSDGNLPVNDRWRKP